MLSTKSLSYLIKTLLNFPRFLSAIPVLTNHSSQWIFGNVHRQIFFLRNSFVQSSQHRSSTGKVNSRVVDIRGQFRRRLGQGFHYGIFNSLNGFVQGFCNFSIRNSYLFWFSGQQIPTLNRHFFWRSLQVFDGCPYLNFYFLCRAFSHKKVVLGTQM